MKLVLAAAFLFALNAHANPDFSGHWAGECFDGWNAWPHSVNVEQKGVDSIAIEAFGQRAEHQLQFSPGEEFREQTPEDMDNHLEFKAGVHHWFWCAGTTQDKICRDSRWETWSEFATDKKTLWQGGGDISFDPKGRLVIRNWESYQTSTGHWEATKQEYCRFERKN